MSLDPYTGYIKAYVGGIDHKFFKFDQVFQGKRQPGSTFKPFAYLAAMDCGFSPCSRMTDKPIKIRYEGGQEWEPHNANEKFSYRNMTLRRALGRSCNAITAQLTDSIGWGEVIEYAHKCGIRSKLDSVPSICLGCSDVSFFELVNAYGTILNQVIRVDPILIVKITDKTGKMHKESFEISDTELADLQKSITKCVSEIQSLAFWDKECGEKECEWCTLRASIGETSFR